MKTQPLKGMRDLLPREQALRDYIQGQILATYRAAGFQRISTPILEDMENLDKSEGGDNLNLIFKVLKRGDKLEHALASGDEKQLSDMGLRYDLTLPLSRYYAANRNELPSPFKVIQTDRVYRAERPQKGRLREFVQCDIDILGDSSPNAEVELIDVTARALLKIGFTGFTININDRRILRAMLEKMGFAADQLDSVCISFDKMDKIGSEGVKNELTEKGFAAEAVTALDGFLRAGDFSLDTVAAKVDDEALTADLRYVIATSEKIANGRYGIAYAPSLVRGQGYYTGMVFEVTCPQFSGAVAGVIGAMEVTAVQHKLIAAFNPDIGFDGIVVALLANNNPLGVILSGFFFGALKNGGSIMQRVTSVPQIVTEIIMAIIILTISADVGFKFIRRRKERKTHGNAV